MKKFITEIVLLSLLSFGAFYIFDKAITKGLRQSNMLIYDNLTKIFNGKINADLVINGSSKAYVQVSPRIVDSVLNLNSYNLGLDGTPFVPQKMQYELYEMFNTSPKYIIQIVGSGAMTKPEGDLYNYIKYAPYLDLDVVRETTELYNGFSFFDYNLPLFKYSGQPLEVIDGVLSLVDIHIAPSTLYKGYLEQNMSWDGSFDKFKETHKDGIEFELDETARKLFEEYIIHCKKNNINLFLVNPPVYYEFIPYDKDRDKLIDYYTHISNKYDIPYLDFSTDEITFDKKYFYNSQHLNSKGAELFSKKLSIELKDRAIEQEHKSHTRPQ
tara:strand:+ start:1301 stop:2281 length:981 start_codon:yes stop_codon:yes gene_type:complete